jgi:hypothetical protein
VKWEVEAVWNLHDFAPFGLLPNDRCLPLGAEAKFIFSSLNGKLVVHEEATKFDAGGAANVRYLRKMAVPVD